MRAQDLRLSLLAFTVAGSVAVVGFNACVAGDSRLSSGSGADSGTGNSVGGDFLDTSSAGGSGGGCARSSTTADELPLDMYIMLDHSSSMDDAVSGGTKWSTVTDAIDSFMQLPDSAGIGVGIQYFPIETGVTCPLTCQSDTDCGTGCGTCFKLLPQVPGVCTNAGGDSCTASDYATPEVSIETLPGAYADITISLGNHSPSGNTPTGVALQGAIDYARGYATAHPNHVVIAVLATDGEPTTCDPSDIPGIQAIAAAGVNGSPSVLTFVIGVGSSLGNMNAIAQSGGSGQAFIVDTQMDVEAQFLDALNTIKGSALGCVYAIPAPDMGEQPDYGRVNVEYTPGDGAAETFPKVGSAAECSGDGWYYDNNEEPTQIILCPASCQKVGADDMGRVDIVLGCATVLK